MDLHLITEKLANSLNESYDVIHMDTVISVIASLENSDITKEQLESTRLAKYINELRKKTASEALAKRSKNLLKKWREMVCHRAPVDLTDSNSNSNFPLMKKKRKKKSPSPTLCAVSDDLSLSNSSLTTPALAMSEKTELTFTGRFAAASSQVINEGEPPPKKRGRKKGSKGVDALLSKNNIDQLLKTSKLLSVATGGHKKIKTTQELLADIQGRQSVEVPENVMSSGSSESSTPENSNIMLPNGISIEHQNECFEAYPITGIETELQAIRAQLPQTSIAISSENYSSIVCTCYIQEIAEKEKDEHFKIEEIDNEIFDEVKSLIPTNKILKPNISKLSPVKSEAMKKSIFDFDYEEGNDPLDEIVREVKQKTVDADTGIICKLPLTDFQDTMQDQEIITPISKYDELKNVRTLSKAKQFEILEDENCPAKDFYIVRVGRIGHHQIQSLHNYYIQNINGNIVEDGIRQASQTDRIVPQYNHISFEWIPKNLSEWNGEVQLKNKEYTDEVFLGYVKQDKDLKKIKKSQKRKKMKAPLTQKNLKSSKIVNGNKNIYRYSDIDTSESSPQDACTDDSNSSINDFHQVTSSSNLLTSNRIILTIKKTSHKKNNCENKENFFVKNKIKVNGYSTEKNKLKPLQVQKKDLISKIISLSDDSYLEKKFPALRCSSDETTIFMAHELSPLSKLIKLSDDIVAESAPAPTSSSDTDETYTESGSVSDNTNEDSSDESDTSTNTENSVNDIEYVAERSVLVPEPNILIPETPQNENFREWYETIRVRSYNDELLTILPYVIFD